RAWSCSPAPPSCTRRRATRARRWPRARAVLTAYAGHDDADETVTARRAVAERLLRETEPAA
ncbi:hypothetical protein ACFUTV_32125, partial [Streptomyces sp. NPDC057298]|uniref:hypothetical protein n=1 Tax=Streptomyces sp. NPDC057298 TaxID=3346091 RepID=UPI00362FA567